MMVGRYFYRAVGLGDEYTVVEGPCVLLSMVVANVNLEGCTVEAKDLSGNAVVKAAVPAGESFSCNPAAFLTFGLVLTCGSGAADVYVTVLTRCPDPEV